MIVATYWMAMVMGVMAAYAVVMLIGLYLKTTRNSE